MSNFIFCHTPLNDVYIIEGCHFPDKRGTFYELFRHDFFADKGIDATFVQHNESVSYKAVLRGLHYQRAHPQGKLVRVVRGCAFDVAVDLRKRSSTFGKGFGIELREGDNKQVWVPEGFAHGFLSLADHTVFSYSCTDYYTPGDEYGILWNSIALAIAWPDIGEDFIVSDKDSALPVFDAETAYFL